MLESCAKRLDRLEDLIAAIHDPGSGALITACDEMRDIACDLLRVSEELLAAAKGKTLPDDPKIPKQHPDLPTFQNAAEWFEVREWQGSQFFCVSSGFDPPVYGRENALYSSDLLQRIAWAILPRDREIVDIQVVAPKAESLSVERASERVKGLMDVFGDTDIDDMADQAKSRSDLIAMVLGSLDLARTGQIEIEDGFVCKNLPNTPDSQESGSESVSAKASR